MLADTACKTKSTFAIWPFTEMASPTLAVIFNMSVHGLGKQELIVT